MKILFAPAFFVTIALSHSANAYSLQAGDAKLQFSKEKNGSFGLRLNFGDAKFEQKAPVGLEIAGQNDRVSWLNGGYRTVVKNQKKIDCEAELVSSSGSHFRFLDSYSTDTGGFQLERRVEITSSQPGDIGFSSRFGLAWTSPMRSHEGDTFMPGSWYGDNKSVPKKAFASNLQNQVLLTREDRLGLPLTVFRDPKSGISLEMERIGGTPTTFAGETGGKRFIDERFQVGALGFFNAGKLETVFTFPGSEDDRPFLGPNSPQGSRYLPRFHPVKSGHIQNYILHFEARKTASFASLVELTTKAAVDRAQPVLYHADLKRVYRSSLELLDTVIQPYNGTVSVPFQVALPGGEVIDTSMQMGFVGMALPSAALLLRDGLQTPNASSVERAEKVLDFWVKNAVQPSGVPKNWVDLPRMNQTQWRPFPTHLRVASDGMDGVLRAWDVARKHGMDRPQWLQFARSFGDFLVKNQNPDGSWYGSWKFDGQPQSRFTNASTHPIEFMVDLSIATGDSQYRKAALRAGEFSRRTVSEAYSYVGGTPDNPNVTDKEAGVMAVRGFMALYDATSNRKWLTAAKQAALFCESWVYWRDLPIPEGVEKPVFPASRSTVGLSLIATGHSAADNFMAFAPFYWYRIYLATGDSHFLRTARLLLHDTKQVMDWDGKLGYRYPGLMPEAMTFSTNRGKGVAGWLPWLSNVVVEPLVRLEETFGTMDIDEIELLPLNKRRELSQQFGKTRGFGK